MKAGLMDTTSFDGDGFARGFDPPCEAQFKTLKWYRKRVMPGTMEATEV